LSDEQNLLTAFRKWAEVFIHHSMQDFRRLMDKTGLSNSQVSALLQLYHCESCGVSDIGAHLGITNAASSQLIDRLVQKALVVREEGQNDRRFKRIALTEQGRELIKRSLENRQKWVAALNAALEPEERKMIIQALTLLTETTYDLETRKSQKKPDHTTLS
jgi:DNA-binding MarR family transcriptional regulator